MYNPTFFPHSVRVFKCFVWIWEQTTIISLYSIKWLVFMTEMDCVYSAVGAEWLCIILRSAHTAYLCVLCGSQNKTAIISLYSIKWLVFMTVMDCVYCAVRAEWLCLILRSAHTVYLCFVWISEQTAIISLYSINWLVFTTETECVYCAVGVEYRWFSEYEDVITVFISSNM